MSSEETKSVINVARMHEQRLLEALEIVKQLFPLDAAKVESLTQPQLFAMEVVTNRFAKLQDLMGTKLFDLSLMSMGETIVGLSMIDKANKLEKISVLHDARWWTEMRKIRNNLTHEYPDQPHITAKILNNVFDHIDSLVSFNHRLIDSINAEAI